MKLRNRLLAGVSALALMTAACNREEPVEANNVVVVDEADADNTANNRDAEEKQPH